MLKNNWLLHHYSRVKAVFILAIGMVLFLSMLTMRGHNQLEQYISSVEKTDQIIQEVRNLKKIVSDSQLGLRGYLSSKDRQFLATFKESAEVAEQHLTLLTQASSQSQAQNKRIAQLKLQMTADFQHGLQIIALKNNDLHDEAGRKLNQASAQARALDIKRLLFDIEREEDNNQQMKLLLLDQSVFQQRNLQYFGFALGLVLLGLSWGFVMLTLRQKDKIEAELNRFFSSSPDLFCIASLDTTIKRSNSSYADLLGYSAYEMLSKSFLDFIHPEDREMALHELRNLKSQMLPTTSFECRCTKKDGSIVWFSWKISLVTENSTFYGVGRDITDRKQLEVENMLARQAALAANEAKSQFLANVSHEIRTPLHGVMGMTKLLLDTPLNIEQRENAENILTSSDNLLAVINDVLDLSKIEAGQMRIEKLDFNLSHLIADVVNNTKNLAEQKNIKLISVVPPVFSNVRGDAHRLRQVLLNLVSNAIKFTEKGHVKIVIESLAEPDSDFGFKFSVQDTGIGLSDKTMKKLFKAFSQADGTTSRRYGGTGLGLSICKQLVELMGGQIGVSSIENEGSTFWFELGFEKASQNAKSNVSSIATAGLTYEGRVLVADDTIINQKVIARTLQKLGLHVDVAENGVQVIEQLQKVPDYDIVFLDGHMPLLDGYDTAKKIRSDKSTLFHKVALVALTANTLKGEREKCLALGMDEFLSKPINDAELHAILGRFLVVEKNSRRAAAPVKAPTKLPGQIIDLSILNKLEYLQNQGEDDIVVDLIGSFLKDTQPRLEKFEQHVRDGQLQKLVDEAHSLKSSSRMVGGLQLGQLLEELENCRHTFEVLKMKSLVKRINVEFKLAQQELKRIAQERKQKQAA